VGPRAGLDRCGISRPSHRDSIPGPSSPVAQSLYQLSYRAHNVFSKDPSILIRASDKIILFQLQENTNKV